MDGTHLHLTVTTFLAFLVLTLLQASVQAQTACSAPDFAEVPENNDVGHPIATINVQPGATVTLTPPGGSVNPFTLNGTRLLAAIVFDAEETSSFTARLMCHSPPGNPIPFVIVVRVLNLNDNPPVFEQTVYQLNVSELSPENTLVGRVDAKDLDGLSLYYRLEGETHGFKLRSSTVPQILVQTPPNYDTVQNVSLTLYVQDTPLTTPGIVPSHNDSTTVEITILDVDNRPPWFQPCTKYEFGNNVICTSSGYTGWVTVNKIEPGSLKLNPGPLHAIDGDHGINEEITYEILGGNDGNLFKIDNNMGNVSMQKEANTLETITLTVLAAQKTNSFQATSTFITIRVLAENLHPPQFQSPRYQGTVTGVGNRALDTKNEPLQFLATDNDYTMTGGLNPNIQYYVNGSSNFSIIEGYLFMTRSLSEGTLNLQVVARDTHTDETATAELLLEVKSGPIPTTDSVSSTSPSASTDGTSLTTAPSGTATKPTESTDGTGLTSSPSGTATKPGESTAGTGLTTAPSGATTKPGESTDGTGLTATPSGATTKPSESTDGTGLTATPSGATTKPGESTDGTGLTATPSGATIKPGESTDGTGLTATPSGATIKPDESTDGTGLTATPSGATIKPDESTDGTGLTATPSGATTKPSESTDGTGVKTTPSSTTKSSAEGSGATSEPSQTSNGPVPTANTRPQTGGYGPSDMVALGVTLGVLLLICLVIIGYLLIHIRRDREDWKKINETNKFRSNLNKGFGSEKEGIQYTNDAFSKDEDGSSTRSGSFAGGAVIAQEQQRTTAKDLEKYLTPKEPSVQVQDDAASRSSSDGDDKEKEVKPILTKGRRQDEGYKSVWFKEDIDPEAKEEVVIIPDSRENDSDVEEQEQTGSNREENNRGNSGTKRPKTRVAFADEMPNSRGEDSPDYEVLSVNL